MGAALSWQGRVATAAIWQGIGAAATLDWSGNGIVASAVGWDGRDAVAYIRHGKVPMSIIWWGVGEALLRADRNLLIFSKFLAF